MGTNVSIVLSFLPEAHIVAKLYEKKYQIILMNISYFFRTVLFGIVIKNVEAVYLFTS